MKTKKKVLLALLSATCLTAGAFGLAACGGGDNRNADIVGVYNQYVAYAEANGETPLTYEAWLNSIKGQQGDPGTPGAAGKSAYDLYRENYLKNNPGGTPLTEEAWVASLTGKNGKGIQKIELNDDNTKLVVTYTDGSSEEVDLPEEFSHVHDYGTDYAVVLAPTETADGLGYQTCEDCGHHELLVIKPYEVTVLLADGKTPAENAAVTINGETVNANAQGVAKLPHTVLPGEYDVAVTLDGYTSATAVKTSIYENEYEIVLAENLRVSDEYNYVENNLTPGSEAGDKKWFHASAHYVESGDNAGWTLFDSYLEGGDGYSKYKLTYNEEYGDIVYWVGPKQNLRADVAVDDAIEFVVGPGERVEFQMTVNTGLWENDYAYSFSVERMTPPEVGSIDAPVSVNVDEPITYTATANKEVYFKLETERNKPYSFEFGNGITVTAFGGDKNSAGTLITSQDLTVNGVSGDFYVKASAADGNISFKMKREYLDGEQQKPIALTLDQPQVATVSFDGLSEVWYKFTPSVTGTYTLAMSGGSWYNHSLYSGDDPMTAEYISSSYSSLGVYELTAGTTYYFCIGASCTLTLREYDAATDGGFTANYPKTITDGTIELTSTDYTYFKYVAPKDGVFVVAPSTESQFAVYSGATFETLLFNYLSADKYYTVTQGQELYFTASAGYSSQIPSYSIKIGTYGETDEVETVYVVKDDDGNALSGVNVTLKKGGTVVGTAQTTGSDGKVTFSLVPADDYTVSLDFGAEADNYQAFAEKALAKNYVPGEVGLTAKKLREFTVNVKLGSEAAGEGITVSYGGYSAETNSSGVATIKMPNPENDYTNLSVTNLPEEYEYSIMVKVQRGTYSYEVILTVKPVDVTRSGSTTEVEIKAGTAYRFNVDDVETTISISTGHIESLTSTSYVFGTSLNLTINGTEISGPNSGDYYVTNSDKDAGGYYVSITYYPMSSETIVVVFSEDATLTISE